jgi:hypothetical protein
MIWLQVLKLFKLVTKQLVDFTKKIKEINSKVYKNMKKYGKESKMYFTY